MGIFLVLVDRAPVASSLEQVVAGMDGALAESGDLVVTQDIPLAAELVPKGDRSPRSAGSGAYF
jgi:uncharacterized protein YaiI (UPF0178 family)